MKKYKLTRKQAMDKFCGGCIYDPKAGGTKVAQIEGCTITSCPLYEYRPVTSATKKLRQEEYIATLSTEELEKYQNKQEVTRKRFSS